MDKKAMILVSLVNEASEISNNRIEREIYDALQKVPLKIPWVDKVLMVRVTEK